MRHFRYSKIYFLFFIIFGSFALSQVFIPFGFWKKMGALEVSPTGPLYINTGVDVTFTATGETGSYNWSITGAASADGALLSAATGSTVDYTGRATPYTNDTLTLSSTTSTTVTIRTYDPIDISPASATLAINASQDFSVSDGYCTAIPGICTDATATWSIVSGGGSISSTGVFTAPATADTTIIQVADDTGHSTTATITTVNTLTITTPNISSLAIKIPVSSTANFYATLGTLPYTYAIQSGSGSVGCNTTLNGAHTNVVGTITVASTAGCPTRGVLYVESEQICYTNTTGTTFTGSSFGGTNVLRGCNGTAAAAHANGIAVNSSRSVFTAPSTIGTTVVRATDALSASSDATITVIKPTNISYGYGHACAMYNDGSIKCWGDNAQGQLGIGSTTNVGDLGTELGGGNAFVNLGTGRTATKIVTGSQHSCALLDNSTVKCWGDNAYGQLGIGGTSDLWARIPSIPASSSAGYFYMYYNNPSAVDAQNASGVWTNYWSVWHLGQDPAGTAPQYTDATGNGRNGTATNSPLRGLGQIGYAANLSASSTDYINISSNLTAISSGDFTFSAWMRTSQAGSANPWTAGTLTGVEQGGGSNDIFVGWINAGGLLGITKGNSPHAQSNFIVNNDAWRHVTMTRNYTSGAAIFYVNGVANGSNTTATGTIITFSRLGAALSGGNYNGYLDEVRIFSSVKSSADVSGDFKFQNNTHLLYNSVENGP